MDSMAIGNLRYLTPFLDIAAGHIHWQVRRFRHYVRTASLGASNRRDGSPAFRMCVVNSVNGR